MCRNIEIRVRGKEERERVEKGFIGNLKKEHFNFCFQMLEMCFLKYRFVILDNAFLVHIPGIKRRTNNSIWRRPYQRQNAKAYTIILKQLANKYEKNQRCRLQ